MALWAGAARADCPPAPDPVGSLAFGSRYVEGDASRSELDPEAADAADAAMEPVEEFLRALVEDANAALEGDAGAADCAVERMAAWARADALAGLESETARLVIGSRLAGFALVLMQAGPRSARDEDEAAVAGWLSRRLSEQMEFWEDDAPPGARRGNLRAWAALGGAALAATTDDDVARGWATWSTADVLCTAAPDGSLPQEMSRGHRALHYQLHAVAPLVTAAALLDAQGSRVADACDGALDRVVGFTLDDLAGGGAMSAAITGEAQSLFDGSDELEDFQLAWIEPYLTLGGAHASAAEALAADRRPLSYSKLGGDQTLLWRSLP